MVNHEWSDHELEELEKAKRGKLRRKPMPWTAEQHQLFLMGLNKYGQGQWRNISRYYVVDKTPSQVASHAYKFFRRCSNNTSTPPAN